MVSIRTSTLILLCLLVPCLGQYNVAGPCTASQGNAFSGDMVMPTSTGCSGSLCNIRVTVTAPSLPASTACSALLTRLPPLVVFFNGFQGRASQYSTYATRLAGYGYAVLQYDTSGTITDAVELRFLDVILANLAANTNLAARIDFTTLAVAGHSRGGKLAALHFANDARIPRVAAAYLVDPVDNTVFSPEGPYYPSASKALAAAVPPRVAGITGASIVGSCNPAGSNYPVFYNALAAGSWLQVVRGASHAAFSSALATGGLLCGYGTRSASTTISMTTTAMIGWFEGRIRGVTPMPTPQLQAWINTQVTQGVITFAIKP